MAQMETESLGKSFANHDAECQTECNGSHNARKHVAMTHRGVLPAESVSCRSPLQVTGSQNPFKDCQLRAKTLLDQSVLQS